MSPPAPHLGALEGVRSACPLKTSPTNQQSAAVPAKTPPSATPPPTSVPRLPAYARDPVNGDLCASWCACVFPSLDCILEKKVASQARSASHSPELAGRGPIGQDRHQKHEDALFAYAKTNQPPATKNSTPTRSNAFLSLLSGTTRYPRHRSNAQRTRSARPRAPLLPSLMTIYTFHSLRPPQCVSTGPGVVRLAGMANERTALRIAAEPLRDEMDS